MSIQVTISKIADHQISGEYKPTQIDQLKKEVDFRIMQTSPFYIRWKSGEGQTVTASQLKKLQANHTWTTDF